MDKKVTASQVTGTEGEGIVPAIDGIEDYLNKIPALIEKTLDLEQGIGDMVTALNLIEYEVEAFKSFKFDSAEQDWDDIRAKMIDVVEILGGVERKVSNGFYGVPQHEIEKG